MPKNMSRQWREKKMRKKKTTQAADAQTPQPPNSVNVETAMHNMHLPAPTPEDLLSHHENCPLFSSQPRLSEGQVVSTRRFDPAQHYPDHFTLDDIQVKRDRYVFLACPVTPLCPHCGKYAPHHECPVIAIDGTCTNDGKAEPRAAIGVFFGDNNTHNMALPLDGLPKHTSQIAELCACALALSSAGDSLERWKRMRSRDSVPSSLHTVVIKSDSAYVVGGITEWLDKWKSNGWKGCKGQPVANAEWWKQIDELVERLEKEVCVKFWLVPREDNEVADAMAKGALQLPKNFHLTRKFLRPADLTA